MAIVSSFNIISDSDKIERTSLTIDLIGVDYM